MFITSHFLNVNISVTLKHRYLEFSVLILTVNREGTVSQIFVYGLVFILCNVESIVEIKLFIYGRLVAEI